jgi:hypothetical protein
LTSGAVEFSSKIVLSGEYPTILIEVVFVDPRGIHPIAQCLVANELCGSDRFVNRRVLVGLPFDFELKNKHRTVGIGCAGNPSTKKQDCQKPS